jgi:hypothetical protein
VINLGYLGVEKDFTEQQYHPYQIGREGIGNCRKKKKSITKIILTKRE